MSCRYNENLVRLSGGVKRGSLTILEKKRVLGDAVVGLYGREHRPSDVPRQPILVDERVD